MTELARVTTLEDLVVLTKRRRSDLGLPQLLVDEIGGLASGHTAKIECGLKSLGKISLPLLLGALKLELAVVPATSKHRGETGGSGDFFSRRARKAAHARAAKLTPKQRKKIARAAAKARWRKSERERT